MKKLLVIFLACAMVLSMCAGFVFAEEADDQAEMGSDPELILYTCYPFYAVPGEKTDRYTVFARKISGPHVIWQ